MVVEIIRHAIDANLIQRPLSLGDFLRLQGTQGDAKPIGLDLARGVRLEHLAEIMQPDAMMDQAALRPMMNGQVLLGLGMLVLQSAVGEPARVQPPAPADGLYRIRGRPAAFLQPVEGEGPAAGWDDVRQFFDLEIFGLLLDLHGKRAGCRSVLPG